MQLSDLITAHGNATAKWLQSDADPDFVRMAGAVDTILDHVPTSLEEVREKARYLAHLWETGQDDFGAAEMRRLLTSYFVK